MLCKKQILPKLETRI